MKNILALAVLLLTIIPAWAKGTFPGENLNRPFTVHGRFSNYNGSATQRIWIVGSKRMLYVGARSPALDKIDNIFADGGGWFFRDIFADFTVEPLTPDIKGHMRPVRIVNVKNVVITEAGKVVSKTRKTSRQKAGQD